MSAIVRLAQIRGLMFDLETEAGMTEISGLEREVLLACADLINTKELARNPPSFKQFIFAVSDHSGWPCAFCG